MYFLYKNEYRIFKVIEIIIRGELRTKNGGDEPPEKIYFSFLFSILEKKSHFCLFKIAIPGDYYDISMYYKSNWFIPSIFLLSTLVPFLW
jgi:hypothetical protein